MRIYIPATGGLLATWVSTGSLTGFTEGHGVTPALRREYGTTDSEELEYIALVEAGLASLHLLAQDPGSARKRVVVSADIDVALAPSQPQRYPSQVQIAGPVPLARVVSVHVDDAAAVPLVRVATDALFAGADTDEITDEIAEHELMWFDATEVPAVAAALTDREGSR